MSGRPSYWDIVVAYLEEGYRAWQAREEASADTVEARLGLSGFEGIRFRQELESQGLIEGVRVLGRTAYNLAPRGLAFVERMPDVQRLLAMQTAVINSSSSGADEKRQAAFSLRDVAAALTEKDQVLEQHEGLGSAMSTAPRTRNRTQERGFVPLRVRLITLDSGEPRLVSGFAGDPTGLGQMPDTFGVPPRTGPTGKANQLEHHVDIGRAPRVRAGETSQQLQRLPVQGDGLRSRVEPTGALRRVLVANPIRAPEMAL
jgi:hypothetical protein